MRRKSGSQGTRSRAVRRPILCPETILQAWILIICLAAVHPNRAWGIRIEDDSGQTIRLTRPAQRIIALYGAFNEILAAMGMEDRLVGRTKADAIPPSILSKPSIGTHMRPNIELILGLKPDLIIQSAGRRQAMVVVQQLTRKGFQIPVFNPRRFEELFSVISRLGILTGDPVAAGRLIDNLKSRLYRIGDRMQGVSYLPKVFFEVRYPNLLGAGRGSIVNDIIHQAGGVNCVESPKKMVRLNMETLFKHNPAFYVIQQGPMNKNPSHPSERPYFRALKAIKDGNVLMVDEQVFSRPGPRSVDAAEQLAAFLHPERFGEDGRSNGVME